MVATIYFTYVYFVNHAWGEFVTELYVRRSYDG